MLSSIFVDRPAACDRHRHRHDDRRRCWRCSRFRSRNIPISCRRRCRSRPFIPARIRRVVDATVAQPIEAQVVGVDKMIYMKSVSGDDGSYSLTASFELGTDPDINAVNVNNRVQIALAQLPPEVQRQGITVKKKSSALLGVIAVYSPKHTPRSAVPLQLRHHQSARPDQEHAGRRRRGPVGAAGLRHAGLGADRPPDRPQSDDRRHHQRHPVAERPGGGGTHRRAADLRRPAACSSTSRPRAG